MPALIFSPAKCAQRKVAVDKSIAWPSSLSFEALPIGNTFECCARAIDKEVCDHIVLCLLPTLIAGLSFRDHSSPLQLDEVLTLNHVLHVKSPNISQRNPPKQIPISLVVVSPFTNLD